MIFGGQRVACGAPGNAGRHHYSGPLFITPGHAAEAGGRGRGVKDTEGPNN